MNAPQHLYVTHKNASFLFTKISGWKDPGIDVHSIPEVCQPARKSPGIDFSGNRSLGAPVLWPKSTSGPNIQMSQIYNA